MTTQAKVPKPWQSQTDIMTNLPQSLIKPHLIIHPTHGGQTIQVGINGGARILELGIPTSIVPYYILSEI